MSYEILHVLSKFLKHGIGVLLLSWRRMFRAAVLVGGGAALVVEILGMLLTHRVPPPGPTHLVAAAFAVALAYGAALTVFVDELLESAIETVGMLEGDAKAGIRAATIAAEREVGDLRSGMRHWLGLAPATSAPQPAPASLASLAPLAPLAAPGAAALAAAVASRPTTTATTTATTTKADSGTTPASPLAQVSPDALNADDDDNTLRALAEPAIPPLPLQTDAVPVRADQLPRIEWAYGDDPADTQPSLPRVSPAAPTPSASDAPPFTPRTVPVQTIPLSTNSVADTSEDAPPSEDASAERRDEADVESVAPERVSEAEVPAHGAVLGMPDMPTATDEDATAQAAAISAEDGNQADDSDASGGGPFGEVSSPAIFNSVSTMHDASVEDEHDKPAEISTSDPRPPLPSGPSALWRRLSQALSGAAADRTIPGHAVLTAKTNDETPADEVS